MTTQTEAIKRWVEVFDGNWHDEPVDSEWADRAHQALAEMRQAIAEAEQPAQTEAEQLADALEHWAKDYATTDFDCEMGEQAAAELRRLQHNNLVLMDALWKACGDDEEMVNGYIESQGELK